jgi:hypothetical protein
MQFNHTGRRGPRPAPETVSLHLPGEERQPDTPAYPDDDLMDWRSEPEPTAAERFSRAETRWWL